MPARTSGAYTRRDSAAFSAADRDPGSGSVGGSATPDIARLAVVIGAETAEAEAGFKRVDASIGGFAKGAALALAAAGTAIVAAGGSAVKSAADFEATLSGVKAVSGATASEMKGLTGLALQLGKDTAFSASEAAAGIEELVKGGLTIPDIMNGAAKATLNLAAAGGVSLPDAATIAANALAQFNLKGKDMAHVSDLIAGAANASALDVGQFKFSLQAAGAVASTIGFSFDDLAVAIAEMGKAGIVGSDAGTSLKTMFMSLTPSTDKAAAEMKKLGIITKDGKNQFFDAAGHVKSLADVQGILQTATKGLTDQQKLASLEIIFGSDAIRAGTVLAKEGAAGYREMAGAMGKVTAEAVGNEKLNNLNGDLQTLSGSVETLAITFGTAFLPVLRDATQWATSFVNGLIPWAERIGPQVVTTVQQLGAALGDLIRTGDVGLFADDVREAFGVDLTPFVLAVREVETVLGRIATGFREGGLGGAVTAWLGEAGRLGQALLTWIGDQVNPIATKLGEWGSAFVGWVGPRIPTVLTALGGLASSVWTWITDTALPTIKEKLLTWGGAFLSWVTPLVTSLPATLGGLATAALTWIGQQAPPILTKLGEWGGQFLAWVAPVVAALPGTLVALATAALKWIGDQAEPVGKKLRAWKDAFLDWVTPLIRSLPTKLGDLKDAAWSWITTNAPALLTKLGEWGTSFLAWVTPVVTGIPTKLGELKDAIVAWVGDSKNWQPWLDKLGEWKDKFLAWVGPLVLALPGELGKVKDAIVAWITDTAVPAIKTGWEKLEPAIVPVIKGALEKARDALKPVWKEITDFMVDFEPTGKRLERLFGTIGTAIDETLKPALAWFGDWVKGMAPAENKGFMWNLAQVVNAYSASLERNIDDTGKVVAAIKPYVEWLGKLGDAYNKLPFAGANPLIPQLPNIPGLTPAPSGVTTVRAPSPRAGETVVGGPDPANGKYAYASDGGRHVEWRDRGGPGYPGHPYGIGVPEVFVPNTPGRFVPLGGAGTGGDTHVTVPVYVGGEKITTVVAKANRRYAARGGRP